MFSWPRLAGTTAVFIGVVMASPLAAQRTAASKPAATLLLDVVTAPWIGDLDGMIPRRRVRLLTPYGRTHYFVDRGRQTGMAYDFGRKLEERLNARLGTRPDTRVHVVVVPTAREELVADLIAGRGDVIASNLTVTPELSRVVDFTAPGQCGVRKVLVTGPGAAHVRSSADVPGLSIVVRESGPEVDLLKALNEQMAQRALAPAAIHVVAAALGDDALLEMVDGGQIAATVVDDFIAAFWARGLRRLRVHDDIGLGASVCIAWAVRKNSPGLLAAVNPIIEAHRVGTTFGTVTLRKYLRGRLPSGAPDGAALRQHRRLEALFVRNGARYGIDPLLLMAQAFQESRLDQRARSRTGAIGIMQVTSAAAVEMNTGDVRAVDANIAAGAKYLRSIIDARLGPTPVDPTEKTLMAFAAYNCGPTCLRRVRRETRRRGLNPDRWFNHVEAVTGDLIGEETVTYVANIYKHYVAYRLAVMEARGAG
jgi:membrane-bound lytic murein transglycosylase MltF